MSWRVCWRIAHREVLVTHDIEEAAQLADQCCAFGSPARVVSGFGLRSNDHEVDTRKLWQLFMRSFRSWGFWGQQWRKGIHRFSITDRAVSAGTCFILI
jgi:hypothetical protein